MALRIHAQMTASLGASNVLLFACPFEGFVSSKLFVANSGGATTFTILAVPAGVDSIVNSNHYLFSAHPIAAGSTVVIPSGITLGRGDELYVSGATNNLTFTLFGEGLGEEG